MGMFDDIPVATPGAPALSAPAGMFDDIPAAAPAQKAAPAAAPPSDAWGLSRYAADYGKSTGSGASRAVAGIVGLPADVAGLIASGADLVRSKVTGRPYEEVRAEANARAAVPTDKLAGFGGDALNRAYGYEYAPESRVGQFLKTGTEFAGQAALMPTSAMRAGAVPFAKGVAALGLLPGIASEAAGQATRGTALEPYARAAAGIGGALAGGRALAPRTVDQAMAGRVGDLSPAERADALARFDQVTADAQARGIPLSNANAFDFATQGRSDLSGLQRHVEAMGGMRDLYARQPAAVDAAARTEFDRIAPLTYAPDAVGPQIGAAAQMAVEQSPQGRALTQAQRDAGPRVTPLQAGEVMQPDLRRIYDERVQAREDASGPLYRAAEAAPERIGVDRMLPVERPGDPVIERPQYSQPQFLPDAPAPMAPPPARGTGMAQETGQPLSLGQFIARNGGLPLEDNVMATDLHRFTVPGYGRVVRPDGKSIDNFWRERLIEEGYFRPDADGGASRDISSDLLRRLQNEQRGVPTYPAGTARGMAPAGDTYGQMVDDYAQAKSLAQGRMEEDLRRAGVDPTTVHPAIQNRIVGALARGEHTDGADAYAAVVNSLREPPQPIARPTTVQEEMYAPRFGQVNPQSVIDHIDNQIHDARGPVRDALVEARRTLFNPATGETDLSVAGLHGARQALNAQIEGAPRPVQSALLGVRNRLDAALSVAPEYEQARATHEAFSRPLDPFTSNRPLGQIVAQDQRSRAFNLAPERVPGVVDQGPSAARDLVDTRSMASRAAYEGHVRTRLLDAATDGAGNISADRLRASIRSNSDLLDQIPDVRRQLESIAAAREGRAVVEQSSVGRLARNDLRTQQAVEALFPANPLPNSEREISHTVGQLAAANPWAARQLVRIHAESVFNEATQKNMPGANQMGGAKFAAVLAGNPQQAANLASAVRALPNGNVIADGFGRFIDVLEAMGRRQNVGSRTAYNAEELKGMGLGKKAEAVAKLAAGGFVKFPAKIEQAMERWRLGRNLDELGRLFSDPNAVPAFRGLLNQTERGGDIRGPIGRLVAIAASSARDAQLLQLTVRPSAPASGER
jgi:hypothetical protein